MLTSPLDAVEQKSGTLRNAKTTTVVKKDEMPPSIHWGHFHFVRKVTWGLLSMSRCSNVC